MFFVTLVFVMLSCNSFIYTVTPKKGDHYRAKEKKLSLWVGEKMQVKTNSNVRNDQVGYVAKRRKHVVAQ